MTFVWFAAFLPPLFAVFFALFFSAKRRGLKREAVLAKCGGTFLAVGLAAAAFLACPQGEWGWAALAFTLLCLAADALLELWFIPGMLCFALAHGVLIVYYLNVNTGFLSGGNPLQWRQDTPWAVFFGVWAGSVALALWLFRRELKGLGRLAPVFVLYPVVLGLMLALGTVTPLCRAGRWRWLLLAGLVCFYASDMMVAAQFFSPEKGKKWEKPCMALYWLALALIAGAFLSPLGPEGSVPLLCGTGI